jgi:hypothetical protein
MIEHRNSQTAPPGGFSQSLKMRNDMRMLRSAIFLMMVSAFGCTGSQTARLQLPPEARIGILNVLEQQMTHVDVGSLRVDSFTKVYNVDWNIPDYINRTIENDLRASGNYTLVPLAINDSAGWKQSMSNSILSAVKAWMPDDLKAYLKQAAEENRLDVIISVSSYDSGLWQQAACFTIAKNAVATKGYGLYTRTRVLSGLSNLIPIGQNTATPFANILVAIFQPRPMALAAFGQAPCSQSTLPDFPWKSDLQFLSPTVIQQIKPFVERLGAEAAQSALGKAGLLP